MARVSALQLPPALARLHLSDYVIMPADALAWVRTLGRRDLIGLALMAAAGLIVGLRLGDIGAGFFAAGLALALWWRIDSRWPFGAALVLLVLIPLMQFAYNRNWLFSGAGIAGGLAVAVWYLLAIGVVRQLLELRANPAAELGPATVDTPTATAAAPPPPPLARVPRRPEAQPLPVPAWRRRLAAIERESTLTVGRRRSIVDGLRSQTPARTGRKPRQ